MPGAGKSTFRAQLAEDLRAAGVEVASPADPPRSPEHGLRLVRSTIRTARRVGLCLRRRRALWWCLRVLWRSPRPPDQRVQAFRFVVVTFERFEVCMAEKSDRVHIIEEGSLQRLFLLLVEHDGVRIDVDKRPYMGNAPFGDVLVHVCAPSHLVMTRLADRERGLPPRLAALDEDRARGLLEQGDALLLQAANTVAAAVDIDRPVRQLARYSGSVPGPRQSQLGHHANDACAATRMKVLRALALATCP